MTQSRGMHEGIEQEGTESKTEISPEYWGSSSQDELVCRKLLFFHLEAHISSLARFQELCHIMT